MNARLTIPHTNQTTIGYLPLWDTTPTDYSTVYIIMQILIRIIDHLEQKNTVITFDQAMYKIGKELQWMRPDEFKHTVIRMGGFHILMNFMGAIGKCVTALEPGKS